MRFRSVLTRVGILVAMGVGALVLGEVAIRIVSLGHPIYNVEMVRYATELKIPGPGDVSHVHRPNSSAKLMQVEIELNSMGHRGPELAVVKSGKRVFVLGSSITMGWGVPFESLFTTIAQRRLNTTMGDVKFVNAGIGNYNSYYQYRLLERQLAKVDPDLVVLHYFINDAEPNPTGKNAVVVKYSHLAAYLSDKWRSLDPFRERIDLVKYYEDLYRPEGGWSEAHSHIREMKKLLDSKNIPLLIMVVPDFHNLRPDSSYKRIYEFIAANFESDGIPTINLFPTFQSEYGSREEELWIQPDDPHPNAKGHDLMARILSDYLLAHDDLLNTTESVSAPPNER
jgi:lysophospholipase L1-like esterase